MLGGARGSLVAGAQAAAAARGAKADAQDEDSPVSARLQS
jgi:hypothetical protein